MNSQNPSWMKAQEEIMAQVHREEQEQQRGRAGAGPDQKQRRGVPVESHVAFRVSC